VHGTWVFVSWAQSCRILSSYRSYAHMGWTCSCSLSICSRTGSAASSRSIVSSLVLWFLVYLEGRRSGIRHLWLPVAANLLVGVSLGLPLFLYMRERRLEQVAG
jgi:hypothetical protein